MSKIGIIRCEAHSEKCAGWNCFPAIRGKTGKFAAYADDVLLIGFDTCGGCARNDSAKIVGRATRLRERGAEVIHLANCLANACPWVSQNSEAIAQATGLPVVLRTH